MCKTILKMKKIFTEFKYDFHLCCIFKHDSTDKTLFCKKSWVCK